MACGQHRPGCPDCGYVAFTNPRVAAVIFLAEADRVLLVQRRVAPEAGRWALAAGFVDFGEPPEAAARREMKEETGLDIAIERLLELGFNDADKVITILYEGRLLGGTLAAADDVADARWFTREDLPELAFDTTRSSIQAWLEGRLGQSGADTASGSSRNTTSRDSSGKM